MNCTKGEKKQLMRQKKTMMSCLLFFISIIVLPVEGFNLTAIAGNETSAWSNDLGQNRSNPEKPGEKEEGNFVVFTIPEEAKPGMTIEFTVDGAEGKFQVSILSTLYNDQNVLTDIFLASSLWSQKA